SVASISIGVVQGTPGSTVSVPVVAGSISQVTNFNFSIYFDNSILTYQGIRAVNSLQGQPVIDNLSGNQINIGYFNILGANVSACSDTILWLDFTYSGAGGISPLVWNESGTQVGGLLGSAVSDVRLFNGMVYGAGVTTPVPSNNGDIRVCELSEARLVVSGSGISSYQWKVSTDGGSSFVNLYDGFGVTGSQSDSLVLSDVTLLMDGNVYLCYVNGVGGPTASIAQRLRVSVITGLNVAITAQPSGAQCLGTMVTYSALWTGAATTGLSYLWTINGISAGTDSVLMRNDLFDGDIIEVEINSQNCEVGSGRDTIQVEPLPIPQLVTGGGSYCIGQPGVLVGLSGSEIGVRYVLDLNGTATTDTILGTGTGLTFGLRTAIGTYSIRAISLVGCFSTMVGSVLVNTYPIVVGTVSGDTAIYPGQSVALQATGGIHYRWSPSIGLSNDSISNPVASPIVTTQYSVVITNLFGCTDTLSVLITVLPLPALNAGIDTTVCINSDTVRLTGTPSGGSWSGQGIVDNLNGLFSPRAAGIGAYPIVYSLTLQNLILTDTIVVVVSDTSAPVSIFQTICAPSNYSFNGQTLTTSGTYTATLTNAAGCDSVVTLNLTVNQPSTSVMSQTICAPNSYSFNGQSYSATGT
ncbi:MAG: hypothetical protein EBZ62_07070, partial [Sphingobacteriia bacterium]|nr:hypothetical protein [Sphingobacteriia bacterium]